MTLVLRVACLLLSLMLSPLLLAQEALTSQEQQALQDEADLEKYFEEDKPVGHRFLSPLASFFIPGLGQTFNQEFGKGFVHFGVFSAFGYGKHAYQQDDQDQFYRIKATVEQDEEKAMFINRDKLFRELFLDLQLNTAFYSSFDAYRVATLSRNSVRSISAAEVIPVSTETLTDLSLAPFTPDVFLDPFVITPLAAAGLYLLGRGSANRANRDLSFYYYADDVNTSLLAGSAFIKQESVAVGEEAFFRGVINTETTRYFGPYYGVAASSVLFGAAHTGEGNTAGPLFASVYGLYLGFLHLHKKGQLRYGVALHYWWNMFVALSVIDRSEEVHIPVFTIDF